MTTYRLKTIDTLGNTEHHIITANTTPMARAMARISHAGTHGVGFSTTRCEDWLLHFAPDKRDYGHGRTS